MKIVMFICKMWIAGAMAFSALFCCILALFGFAFNVIAWFFDSNQKRHNL
jgi:hypothetical protein